MQSRFAGGGVHRRDSAVAHIEALPAAGFADAGGAWMFRGRVEHMEQYGSTRAHFAKIAERTTGIRRTTHTRQFQDVYTFDEIASAKMVYEPLGLTRLQCSPTSGRFGRAVLASERFVRRTRPRDGPLEIVARPW